MGSAQEVIAPAAKAPSPTTTAKPQELAVSSPPARNLAAYSTDWSTARAYYSSAAAASAGGTPPPLYAPPVWGSQMVSPYGTPIPYSPMYPVYAHPSVATTAGYSIAEPGSNKLEVGEGGSGKPGAGSKVTSESADDYGSQSTGGESGSVGSSDTREDGNESQSKQIFTYMMHNDYLQDERLRGISAANYCCSEQQVWSSPHVGIAPKVKPNSANLASAPVGANGVATGHPWMQDEREVKRERRKQSIRESARRSRMRKQQECEDLARKVTELISVNSTLKDEIEQLNRACKDLEAENALITEDLNSRTKTGSQFPFTTQSKKF